MMDTALGSKIDAMSEDVYDYFLREAGDITMADEWYEMALAVADRFKRLIVESMEKNRILVPLLNETVAQSSGKP